jgi:YVTN family beta-propeller protein
MFIPKASAAVYPPTSGTQHYFYNFTDGNMYVYDIDNNFNLVYSTAQPTSSGIRGMVASPTDGMLYIAFGGAGGSYGNGGLLKYNLLTNAVVWQKNYNFGIDSPGITPDGKTIYLADGEFSGSNLWYVIDTSTGNVITSIAAGTGPHNTIVSLDGTRVYMGARYTSSDYIADTSTNTVVGTIGPLKSGGRPFTINGTQTYAFTTSENYLGFQVSNIQTGQVMYTVPVSGFTNNGSMLIPDHGISLSPDEKEIYLIDGVNDYVHVFDVSGLPNNAPTQVANIHLTKPIAGQNESACAYDCGKEGWMLHSTSGRYVFVGDAGDVIDTTTRTVATNIPTLQNSRKYLEIDWQNGQPSFTTNRYGLGYVTTPTPTPSVSVTPTPTPTATPTPTPNPSGQLGQDTFTRSNQTNWGTASDGQTWTSDASTNAAFSIASNTGKVTNTGTNSYNAILGATASDEQVLFTGSLSTFSSTNIGAVIRWADTNNWYKAYIDGTNLVLQKKVNGTATTLKNTAFTATTNTNYSLRFQAVGSTLNARVWITGQTEPTTWTATVTDSSLTAGHVGLRMLTNNGTATYTSFIATNLATPIGTPTPTNTPTPTSTPTPTPTPAPLTILDTPVPSSVDPWGTTFDAAGNVWVAVPGCDPSPDCTNPSPGSIEEYNPATQNWIGTYQLPAGYGQPLYLAFDQSGNLWFPMFHTNSLGMYNPTTQTFQQWTIPTANSGPWDVAVDHNGKVWLTEHYVNQIAEFDPTTQQFTEIATPATSSQPYGITIDSNNNVWFTENNPNIALIAEYTTGNQLLEYKIRNTLPGTNLTPHLITTDPTGNIWWSEGWVGMIGKLDPTLAQPGTTNGVSEYMYPLNCPSCGTHTSGISVDSTGTVWFDDSIQSIFGSLNPTTNQFSIYNTPTSNSHPHDGLNVDKNNIIWFTEEFANKLAEAAPAGVVTPTPTPTATPTPTSTPTPTPTTIPTPTNTPTSTPTNTPTPTPNSSIIAQDTFQRANQTFWGTASDGHVWGADAATNNIFSINSNTAKVTGGTTSYTGTLGSTATNAQILFSGFLSNFTSNNLGGVLRFTDGNNWYKAYIDGSSLIIQKKVNGTATTLKTVSFAATTGTNYTIRFQVVGTTLSAKVWATAGTEPTTWTTTATDSSLASGYCGLRMQALNATATYTSFLATAL